MKFIKLKMACTHLIANQRGIIAHVVIQLYYI